MDNHKQQRELRDAGYRTWIVLPEALDFFEEYGLLEPLPARSKNPIPEFIKAKCEMENRVPKNESEHKLDLADTLIRENRDFEYYEDEICPPNRECHRSLFILRKPAKAFWTGSDIQVIMLIEGRITIEDVERWDAISLKFNTFLATPNYVQFWKKRGFLKQRT
jgi:hypothetical protein